jgi:hypothetical protein
MKVLMRIPRTLQGVRGDEPLDQGRAYDLPDPVALALVATGAAERVAEAEVKRPADEKPKDSDSTENGGSANDSQHTETTNSAAASATLTVPAAAQSTTGASGSRQRRSGA